jgi:hypothetical protein
MAPNFEDDFASDGIASAMSAGDPGLEDSKAHRKPGGGSEAAFIMFLGLTFTLAGVALALGPRFSWKLGQISRGFSYLGVHGGTLLIGGVILAGLGLVRRAQAQSALAADEPNDDQLILERVASDLIQMRNSVEHVARCVNEVDTKIGHVSKNVRDLEFKLRRDEQEARPETPIDDGQRDAIFRLAASVDHVGARIDHRLKSQYDSLQLRLEDISAIVLAAQKSSTPEPVEPSSALPATEATEDSFESLITDTRVKSALDDLRRESKP